MSKHGFSTRSIHKGQKPDSQFGGVVPPIYMTSTYAQESPGNPKIYEYTRSGNPNFTNLEEALASLEMGEFATVFSSGLGASCSVLSRFSPNDRVVSIDDVYGGTFRLMQKTFSRFHIKSTFGEVNNLEWLETELKKGDVKLVWVETPTNPLLKLADIRQIANLCQQYQIELLVDNTFASPYFQTPLELGANLVLHSTTKYIGGHSDVVGGCVISNDKSWKEHLDFARMAMGFNPSPFDTWLTSRSVKTLAIRMEKHQSNAMEIAHRLEEHPKTKQIFYPGNKSHSQNELAQKQMKGFSGIVSAVFDMSLEQVKKTIASFQLFTLAESLGAVESLVCHPASMTHASIPRETRIERGLEDGLIRFSVGIENIEDLWDDLQKALDNS